MENSNQIIPEKIHLIQIKWIKEDTIIMQDTLSKNPVYNFSIAHNMMHNLEKIRLFVDMNGAIDKKEINQGGNYEIDFLFQIDDLANHFQIIDDKPVFNGFFVATLLGICYSTIRGMFFSTWKDTVLNGVILPVISVPELLNSKR